MNDRAMVRLDAAPRAGATRTRRALTIAYFIGACLMHLQFSLWLVRVRDLPWGRHAFADLVPAAALAGGALLLWLVARHVRHSPQPWRLAACWLLWLFAVVTIDRFLTYSANEYFHYPQYGLLAWLIARALDPRRDRHVAGRVLFWTTLAGAADELLQYLWITTGYSHYFDFNDVVVNLVAGVAGVLFYYRNPFAFTSQKKSPWTEWAATALIALSILACIASGRLQLTPVADVAPGGLARDEQGCTTLYLQRAPHWYGSWQDGPRRGRYYVMTPFDALFGTALIAALLAAVGGVAVAPVSRRDNAAADQATGAAAATISRSSASKSR
jgi:hypothetical protein